MGPMGSVHLRITFTPSIVIFYLSAFHLFIWMRDRRRRAGGLLPFLHLPPAYIALIIHLKSCVSTSLGIYSYIHCFFSITPFVPDAYPKPSKARWIYHCPLSNSDLSLLTWMCVSFRMTVQFIISTAYTDRIIYSGLFILKIYERTETGGSDKGLPNYKVEEDQMY